MPSGEIYLRTGIYDLNASTAGTLGVPLRAVPLPGGQWARGLVAQPDAERNRRRNYHQDQKGNPKGQVQSIDKRGKKHHSLKILPSDSGLRIGARRVGIRRRSEGHGEPG